MASTDAKPIPLKNTAYRLTFPIFDADGDLVTGATALDSEVSLDGGTFADCTNEATEIATASGMYYLDLTATEMNADTVSIIVKTTSSGAKTTPIVLYPSTGDINNLNAAITSRLASGTVAADVTAILADTGTDGVVVATASKTGYALSAAGVDAVKTDIFTGQMTEAYAADGTAPTFAQMQYMLWSALSQMATAGTTITCYKLDGTTPSMTFTVDNATNPTSRTRAT